MGSCSQVLFVDDLGTELAGQQFGSVGAGLVEYLVVLAHPLVLRRRGRLGRRWGRLAGRSWSRLLGRPLAGLLGRPLDGLLGRPLAGLSADLRGAAVNGGPDLQVGTDYLDQAVTQHVDAAAPLETLQGALAGEPEQQLLAAHLDDVGVLAEQRVSEPLA